MLMNKTLSIIAYRSQISSVRYLFGNILQADQVSKVCTKQSITKFKVSLSMLHLLDNASQSVLGNYCLNRPRLYPHLLSFSLNSYSSPLWDSLPVWLHREFSYHFADYILLRRTFKPLLISFQKTDCPFPSHPSSCGSSLSSPSSKMNTWRRTLCYRLSFTHDLCRNINISSCLLEIFCLGQPPIISAWSSHDVASETICEN